MGKTRSRATQASVTLDAGALIAIDRGNGRMIALLQQIAALDGRIHVPAGIIGQAWRDGARQALLSRFLRSPQVEVRSLDDLLARACGELCAATHTSDILDAAVVLTAREHHDAIVTSDVNDLRRLDPTAKIARI